MPQTSYYGGGEGNFAESNYYRLISAAAARGPKGDVSSADTMICPQCVVSENLLAHLAGSPARACCRSIGPGRTLCTPEIKAVTWTIKMCKQCNSIANWDSH